MNIRLTKVDNCADYLRSKGITLTPSNVTTAKNPYVKDLTCLKFNVKLTSYTGNVVRAYTYSTADTESAWNLISWYFSKAVIYIDHDDIKDFARVSGYKSVKEARKAYNIAKKAWENLLSLGLSYDDMDEIMRYTMHK